MVTKSQNVAKSLLTDPEMQAIVSEDGLDDALCELGGDISKADLRDAIRTEIQDDIKQTSENGSPPEGNELKYTASCNCTSSCYDPDF